MSAENARPTRLELLSHAARCYRNARLEGDACRCLENAGKHGEAALLHQAAKRWRQAAGCYERAENWSNAARCHLEDRSPLEAARCLLEAGDPLEAGWVLAHLAHNYERARAMLANLQLESTELQLALTLARGRCALPRKSADAGRAVREVIRRVDQTTPGADRERVLKWAFTLAHDVMDRPDLTAALFAAVSEADIPDAEKHWERWAERRLGSAEGIFTAEEEARE